MSQVLKITLGVVLGGIVLIVGCGALLSAGVPAPETVTDPIVEGAGGDGEELEQAPQEPETATVGDALQLEGFEGLRMAITLENVEKGISGGEFDQPPAGTEFVGVNLQLENVGQTTYNDSPSNGATLVDSDDQQYTSTLLTGGQCTGSEQARVAPGDTRSVCIPFEVPQDANLRLFQFALDSGFSEQGGEWRLGRERSGG